MRIYHTKIAIILFAGVFTISILVLVFLMNKKGEDVRVKFIIPEDYQGFFYVEHDQMSQLKPAMEGDFYLFKIPKSGVLRTPQATLLGKWHTISATNTKSDSLEVSGFDNISDQSIALRPCGARTPQNINATQYIYVVGTADAIRWYRKSGIYIEADKLNSSYQSYLQKQEEKKL